MKGEFELPTNFASLLEKDDESGEEKEEAKRITEEKIRIASSAREISSWTQSNESVERVCFELTENEPTRVLDQEIFEDVYHLVQNFRSLPTMSRVRVLDSLCANLSVLSASITALCVGNASDEEEEEMAPLRSALKAYSFFLAEVMHTSEEEAKETQAMGDRGEASWRREEEVQLGEERAAGRVEVGRATRTRDARHERCAGRGLVSRVQTETGGPGVLSAVY